jgi:hypothetical protein
LHEGSRGCGEGGGGERCGGCGGARSQGAGADGALGTAGYVPCGVGGADCVAAAAEAGGVEGGAGVVVCGAGVAALSFEEFTAVFEVCGVVLSCGDGELEGCEHVGCCERGERREEEWGEDGSHFGVCV